MMIILNKRSNLNLKTIVVIPLTHVMIDFIDFINFFLSFNLPVFLFVMGTQTFHIITQEATFMFPDSQMKQFLLFCLDLLFVMTQPWWLGGRVVD